MIECSVEDSLGIVTISRQEKANCLSKADKGALSTAINAFGADERVTALVLTGQGDRVFCAGSDISEMGNFDAAEMYDMLGLESSMYRAVLSCPKPVIGCINGHAMGAGLILAMVTDYAVVQEGSRLGAPELAIGVSAPLEGLLLPWLVGLGRAREIFYLAEAIDASRAVEYGLMNEVASFDGCRARAAEVAQRISNYPGNGFRVQKAILNRLIDTGDLLSAIRESQYMTSFQLADPDTVRSLQGFSRARS